MRRVVHGVRTAAAAGARAVVLTNGCGGLDPRLGPGHPGPHPRPPQPHRDVAARGRDVRRPDRPVRRSGCGTSPTRSTPRCPRASTRSSAARTTRRRPRSRWPGVMGADLVGMSTTLEAIAARHVGLEVLGHLAGDQPRGRDQPGAALARGGPRGRPRRRPAHQPPARRHRGEDLMDARVRAPAARRLARRGPRLDRRRPRPGHRRAAARAARRAPGDGRRLRDARGRPRRPVRGHCSSSAPPGCAVPWAADPTG